MYFCYLDEAGGAEAPGSSPGASPLMLFAGLIIRIGSLASLTAEFLHVKRRFYPEKVTHRLNSMLTEIKGERLRAALRSQSRRKRRHALGVLDAIVNLIEEHDVRIVGRVWVKQPATALHPDPTYTYAVQDIARHFNHFLARHEAQGLVMCDARDHRQDVRVAHSVFTQKHKRDGDTLPLLAESAVFGRSENYAGLQLADIIASALLFPIAARVYCQSVGGIHVHQRFDVLRMRYADRLNSRQYRYQDSAGRMRGGMVVSDKLGGQPSGALFEDLAGVQ